jgi:hypothetical protein
MRGSRRPPSFACGGWWWSCCVVGWWEQQYALVAQHPLPFRGGGWLRARLGLKPSGF